MANSEFRNKLTVLLEDLIKTAMVDICTLADVCTTNLHMELNASRSQNKELKRKLHIMQQSLYNTTLLQSQDDQNKPTPATDAGSNTRDASVSKETEINSKHPEPTTRSKNKPETGIQKPYVEFEGIIASSVEVKSQDSDSGFVSAQTTQQVHFLCPNKRGDEVTVKDEEREWYDGSFVSESDPQQSSPLLYNGECLSMVLHNEHVETSGHVQEHDTMSEVAPTVSTRINNKGLAYICDLCGKALSSEKSLNAHYTVHTADRSHECIQCGKQFVNRTNLVVHQNIHNMHNKNKRPSNYRPKCKYICSICGKRFLTIQELNCHLATHSGEKSFSCMWCGKKFAQQHILKIHQNTHTGAKPFTCPTYQMLFADPSHLDKHNRMHRQ